MESLGGDRQSEEIKGRPPIMGGATLSSDHQAGKRSLVLPVRIELTTSPLPRGCSTTELRQRAATAENSKNGAGAMRRSLPYGVGGRKRGRSQNGPTTLTVFRP